MNGYYLPVVVAWPHEVSIGHTGCGMTSDWDTQLEQPYYVTRKVTIAEFIAHCQDAGRGQERIARSVAKVSGPEWHFYEVSTD